MRSILIMLVGMMLIHNELNDVNRVELNGLVETHP